MTSWLLLPRWARAALLAVPLLVAAAIIVTLYLRHRDHAAVEMHERDITADVAARVANAYQVADQAEINRQVEAARASQETQDAIDDAVHANPTAAAAPAGPAARAAVDSLRSRSR